MAKLFVFGIGGTGSRVLRSLTMLLAAGVDSNGYDIVPMVIDPDLSNADRTRSVQLMKDYMAIRERLNFTEKSGNTFFKTPITALTPDLSIPISYTSDKTFDQFIGLANMEQADRAMAEMLFSEHNLNSSMNVGFKGNPNIGSVVLNQLEASDQFKDFANAFGQNDRIFIISSIFGGTGASGFPLLMKTLRLNQNMPNKGAINNAPIGAVSVLPYFALQANDDSEIDSSSFFAKTRAALRYYKNNVDGVDALYYIGQMPQSQYSNNEGGTFQKNDANLIEVLAATAVIDFCKRQTSDNHQTEFLEVGLNGSDSDATLLSLPASNLRPDYAPQMTELALLYKCLCDDFNFVSSSRLEANRGKNGLGTDIYGRPFITGLKQFLENYKYWIDELTGNRPSFAPFNMYGKPAAVVNGQPAKKKMRGLDKDWMRSELNRAKPSGASEEDRLMETYCHAARQATRTFYQF